MSRSRTADPSLMKLLDRSRRPVYAVDVERRIVYCNAALARWLGLGSQDVIGQYVEYHSEPISDDDGSQIGGRLLTGLCPPPAALAGEKAAGTVSWIGQDGRLLHRQAEFEPLATATPGVTKSEASDVIVLLAERDLSPQELDAELVGERSGDELHRTIRRFRRDQAKQYAIESFLGDSSAIRKIRAQVKAAAASGANIVILGRRGTGRAQLARAIHYRATADAESTLIPVDCELLSEENWRRTLDAARRPTNERRQRPTLLLTNCDKLAPEYQSRLYDGIRRRSMAARIIATVNEDAGPQPLPRTAANSNGAMKSYLQLYDDGVETCSSIAPKLLAEMSIMTIRTPRLVERLEDLPILAQCFLEANNCRRDKQVGSIRPEALDLLALHAWPGELDELRDVIDAAHRAATSHQITSADLPAVIHHAAKAASIPTRRPPEPIVLDDLLATIEKEVIVRALVQARGNKTEAAALLGMTRPRLYRRLVQLGMVSETASEPAIEEIVFEPESPGLET